MYDTIVAYGLSKPAACQEYPFDDTSLALRHCGNRKIFALFLHRPEGVLLNLKCEPLKAELWRGAFDWVIPGFHMNKTHWISVVLDREPVWDILREMIDDSFLLTRPRQRHRKPIEQEQPL